MFEIKLLSKLTNSVVWVDFPGDDRDSSYVLAWRDEHLPGWVIMEDRHPDEDDDYGRERKESNLISMGLPV